MSRRMSLCIDIEGWMLSCRSVEMILHGYRAWDNAETRKRSELKFDVLEVLRLNIVVEDHVEDNSIFMDGTSLCSL